MYIEMNIYNTLMPFVYFNEYFQVPLESTAKLFLG